MRATIFSRLKLQAHRLDTLIELTGWITVYILFVDAYSRCCLQITWCHTVAAPTHRNTLLEVSFRNNEVLLWNLHLAMCRQWLFHADVHLTKEVVEWCDQIIAEIKVIMVHLTW